MAVVYSIAALICAGLTAQAALIYELTPSQFKATAGETIQTFASITNTGPETLYYAYSFVGPFTVPLSGVTGQLPPMTLDPGESVNIVAARFTIATSADVGTYAFTEGVAYHPGPDLVEFVEASDTGTITIQAVPEPSTFVLSAAGLLLAWLSSTIRFDRNIRRKERNVKVR